MSTPMHKFELTPEEGNAAIADLVACERGFDLIYLQHQQYAVSHKVAVLLRRIDKLKEELAAAQVKINYGGFHY